MPAANEPAMQPIPASKNWVRHFTSNIFFYIGSTVIGSPRRLNKLKPYVRSNIVNLWCSTFIFSFCVYDSMIVCVFSEWHPLLLPFTMEIMHVNRFNNNNDSNGEYARRRVIITYTYYYFMDSVRFDLSWFVHATVQRTTSRRHIAFEANEAEKYKINYESIMLIQRDKYSWKEPKSYFFSCRCSENAIALEWCAHWLTWHIAIVIWRPCINLYW